MNWRAFDLNLLIVFDGVMQDRSVTRAAKRLGMSQPYLSAGAILAESDLVATLSRRIAGQFVRTHALQLRELPIMSPIVRAGILWHRTLDNHPAHRWVRDVIVSVGKSV